MQYKIKQVGYIWVYRWRACYILYVLLSTCNRTKEIVIIETTEENQNQNS